MPPPSAHLCPPANGTRPSTGETGTDRGAHAAMACTLASRETAFLWKRSGSSCQFYSNGECSTEEIDAQLSSKEQECLALVAVELTLEGGRREQLFVGLAWRRGRSTQLPICLVERKEVRIYDAEERKALEIEGQFANYVVDA